MEPMEHLILDYHVDKLKEDRKPIWIKEEEKQFISKPQVRQKLLTHKGLKP